MPQMIAPTVIPTAQITKPTPTNTRTVSNREMVPILPDGRDHHRPQDREEDPPEEQTPRCRAPASRLRDDRAQALPPFRQGGW